MRNIGIHSFVENELEAPSLAWSSLAWYWGLSFLGMGPKYIEYMQSGEWEIDKAFLDESNDQINQVLGYGKNMTLKDRFDRAVDYYEYCCIRGRETSINPPWDFPPNLDTLIAYRNRLESQSQPPDQIIKATTDDILDENPDFQALWEAGGQIKRELRAKTYSAQVKEAMSYIHSEVAPRMQLTLDQLDKDTGFLTTGNVEYAAGITCDDLDEVMDDERQWEKLGDVYTQKQFVNGELVTKVVSYGIIGRYYTAGHNLETAMWNEEKKRELSGIHHAIVHSWRQLMDLNSKGDKDEHISEST